jgi:NADPH:quinone reductase-like Zn-dependent oxidoreductase
MRAILLTDYGTVDKLELREVPEPQAGAGEVKVRVAASSVNPIDWKIRSEMPPVKSWPSAPECVHVASARKS